MKQQEPTRKVSEKISQRWDRSGISAPSLLALEVDMVVLSKELSKLEDYSGNIVNQLRELRQWVSEPDYLPEYEVAD